jgi:hypothetical protein
LQPCSRGDPTAGFGICAINHIFFWYEGLRSCCLNVSSLDTFKQHDLRPSYQKKIWLIAHIPKPAVGSPLEHGCKDGKFCLGPILLEGGTLACLRIVIFDICPVCNHIVTEV